ncbi:MAG: hypothetical protein IJB85_12875 [Clostridia bacterium]|nr:hypothetical protein [Clostridia bacterium]
MKEKPIRKMSREELLELLIQYTDEKEALEHKVAQLEEKLALAQKQLSDRAIAISRAGSIAEASIQLSGVFEAAQKAADQYLENIRRMYPQQTGRAPAEATYNMMKAGQTENLAQDEPSEQGEVQPGLTRRRKRGMGL